MLWNSSDVGEVDHWDHSLILSVSFSCYRIVLAVTYIICIMYMYNVMKTCPHIVLRTVLVRIVVKVFMRVYQTAVSIIHRTSSGYDVRANSTPVCIRPFNVFLKCVHRLQWVKDVIGFKIRPIWHISFEILGFCLSETCLLSMNFIYIFIIFFHKNVVFSNIKK